MDANERAQRVRDLFKRRLQAAFPDERTAAERLAGTERLTVYLGIDPTGTELHLGHAIQLLVLRDLAALGHDAVLLIGDFTARIGDPTGKHAARSALSADEVEAHMATYIEQAERIIPKGSFRVAYNSEWLSALSMQEVLRLTSMVTVQQMIQRDMFQQRLKEEKPIFVSEFLYPLMQGYDSVALRTDVEIGGNDQTFNMLVGRELERELLGKDKIVLATKLLVDTTSGKKMSKSEGALIAINDTAQEIRRKVLAADDMMVREMFMLCTDVPRERIDAWQPDGERPKDPRGAKEALAAELVRMYHGEQAVGLIEKAEPSEAAGLPLSEALVTAGAARTMGEAKRLVEQGAVRIDGVVAMRWDIVVKKGETLEVGKGRKYEIT